MYSISNKFLCIPLYLLTGFLLIKRYRVRSIGIFIAITAVLLMSDQLASSVLKPWVHRLRPCHNPALTNLIHLVGGCGGSYGFVSSHAANLFALTTLFWRTLDRPLRIIKYFSLGIAIIVSYSRVYLGVHYPADVVVGAILGTAIGWATACSYNYLAGKFLSSRQKEVKSKLGFPK